MKVITKCVLDLETLQWIPELEESYEYFGPIEKCGGGASKTTQEQQQLNLQASQQQLSFTNQLMGLFSQQFSNQQNVLNFLKSTVQPEVAAGGQGYTPAQLAAQRTGATDTNAEQFQNAEQALNEQTQANSGGSKLTGTAGATEEAEAGLDAAEAQTQASSQEQITQANANLQQQNYWNGINVLSGVAAQDNPLGYSSAATGGSGAVAGLSGAQAGLQNATTNANNNSFLGTFGKTLGGVLGGVAAG